MVLFAGGEKTGAPFPPFPQNIFLSRIFSRSLRAFWFPRPSGVI